jgi:hypothetical protein
MMNEKAGLGIGPLLLARGASDDRRTKVRAKWRRRTESALFQGC